MVRLSRCKKCNQLLSSIKDSVPYGSNGCKFYCCGLEYYRCLRATCKHKQNFKLFYQNPQHLQNHLMKYHPMENVMNDDQSIAHSYKEGSSIGRYFEENSTFQNTFPTTHQRSAIKNIITMACSNKKGVLSLAESICDQSFAIFFAIVQISFLANDAVLKYLSVILSLVLPLWKASFKCQLDIPHTSHEIKRKITSTNNFSVRSLIPMPEITELKDHCYTSIQSLLAYTAMTCNTNSKASKPRYISWMNSKSCSVFIEKIKSISEHSKSPTVVVFMVFWSDGFDPTTSMKRNRRSVWIMTVTFFFYDIGTQKLYMVESCLLAIGPGRNTQESKEDHSCVFKKLKVDFDSINNIEDGSPLPLRFVSRAHRGTMCHFYLCKETYFAESNVTVDSGNYIMDNPERRSNFGLLGGNSLNHAYFGLSCNFMNLKLPFESCSSCQKEINTYCSKEGWIDQLPPMPRCNQCHGFSIDHLLEHGKYSQPIYSPIETVDKDELPGSHLFDKPGKLSNTLLIDAYIVARDLFLGGKISEKEVQRYLSVLCFNSKTILDLIEQCRVYQLSIDIESGSNEITNDDRMDVDIAKEQAFDGMIQKPSPPAMLFICNLECAVETVMHLGMNASKHCEQASFLWAKDIPRLSSADLILGVQKYIRAIDSLKMADFPVMQFSTDCMGGYVAENHRAYMQLAPWAFRWIHNYKDERSNHWLQSLNIDQVHNWSKKDMLSWLSVRRVPINRKMLKQELILKVKESKDISEVRPFKSFSGHDMRQMMLALNSFLSAMFATDLKGNKAIYRLNSLARLYLCFSVRIDQYLMHKKPTWITTFSLLGMLRVSQALEVVPYPICLYEGDDMGEGIVKDVRPMLLTGLRKGWSLAAHGTFYRMKTLSYMQDLLLTKDCLDILAVKKRPVRSKVKIYKYVATVEDAIKSGQPFVFALFREIFTGERLIGIVYSHQKQYYIRVLNVADEATFQDPCGFAYFTTSTLPKKEHIILDDQYLNSIALTFVAAGVALPSFQPGLFAFILGCGQKKVSGQKHLFSPTIFNKRHTAIDNSIN